MDVFCFGDSITFGESDTERGGWVDRLKTECMAGFLVRGEPEVNVFNLTKGKSYRMRRRAAQITAETSDEPTLKTKKR